MRLNRRALSLLLVAGVMPAVHGCGGDGGGAGPSPAAAPAPDATPSAPPTESPPGSAPPGTASPPQVSPPALPGTGTSAARPRIEVAFLVAGGASDGAADEWITEPELTFLGDGPGLQVRARARRVDAEGDVLDILALWHGDDMLSLSGRHGHEVRMTVLRTGTGTLTVSDRRGTLRLAVNATEEAGVWTVRFVQ